MFRSPISGFVSKHATCVRPFRVLLQCGISSWFKGPLGVQFRSHRISGGETASTSDTSPPMAASTGQPVDQLAVAAARNASSAAMLTDWLTVDRRTRLDPRLARWLLLFVSISPADSTPFIRRPVLSSIFPPDFRSPGVTDSKPR